MCKYNDDYHFWMVLKDECDKIALSNNDLENAMKIVDIEY